MPFSITTPHPYISVVTFTGSFDIRDWHAYEREFRDLYVKHTRAVIVFDLRRVSLNISPIVDFISHKKDLLASLKPRTCKMLFAAVVLTEYELISELVLNIAKASGQASLFYACSRLEEVVTVVGRLVAVLDKRKIAYGGGLQWKDVSTGSILVMLLAFFIRIGRHFLNKKKQI